MLRMIPSLLLHSDDTENTISPQSDNESNLFSQPDITSNGRATPDDTESMPSDVHCETPNLRRSPRIRPTYRQSVDDVIGFALRVSFSFALNLVL